MLLLLCAQALVGCATLEYYAQAVSGHFELMQAARPIEEMLAFPQRGELDPRTREQLREALALRDFSVGELGLPDNPSYRNYADLKRPFVVWNVVAAPEFSLRPKVWCFPIAGCLAYRGYYAETDARALAEELRNSGYDVSVGGVRAYSTLGWFDDPVLNSMLAPPSPYLAGVMFHELAHQQLYIEDDSKFNEAFATAVQRIGQRRWLEAHGQPGAVERLAQAQHRQLEFAALLRRHRAQLASLYESGERPERMRKEKRRIFAALRAAYDELEASWDGGPVYRGFFSTDLNNARLVAVATYLDLVPAFEQLAREQDGDLNAFYAAAAALGALDPVRRAERLQALSKAARDHGASP
ncbi:MAG: aminopeptidase [Pseudomonadota bacterium]